MVETLAYPNSFPVFLVADSVFRCPALIAMRLLPQSVSSAYGPGRMSHSRVSQP